MKVLFDSSILIAAIIASHSKHRKSFSWLSRARQNEFNMVVAAHSLLEIYSVLTGAPLRPKISPRTALKLIDVNIRNIAHVQSISSQEYIQLLENIEALNLTGGSVYDALIFFCAKKAGVDQLVTLNAKDFDRFNKNSTLEIISL